MARQSVIAREAKRARLYEQHLPKREAIVAKLASAEVPEEEKWLLRLKLQKLPRNSSKVRQNNRCALTGRPRGVYARFGLGRNKLREHAMKGEIPGLIRSSW